MVSGAREDTRTQGHQRHTHPTSTRPLDLELGDDLTQRERL